MNYTIRRALPEDVRPALDLALRVFLEFEAQDYEPEATTRFKDDIVYNETFIRSWESGNNSMFVALEADKIIGVIAEKWNNGHTNIVFVDGKYHRYGIATALMKQMIEDLKARGFTKTTLFSSPYGLPFYEHFGFTATGSEQKSDGFIYTPMEYVFGLNLTIKPLTPDLADDYFDFFENRAFTDDSPYRCYCQVYQMDENEYQQTIDSTRDIDPGAVAKSIAAKQIASGALQGYLAYDGEISIGWCNANDRANFPKKHAYDDLVFFAPAEKREIAVVCFEIAPEYRGKGVATALLSRVIDDARNNDYTAVVGFAEKRAERFEWDCRGPLRLYEKLGFVPVEQVANIVVMRNDLRRDNL
jgi:GNAT superfamily N-acetyltransferase